MKELRTPLVSAMANFLGALPPYVGWAYVLGWFVFRLGELIPMCVTMAGMVVPAVVVIITRPRFFGLPRWAVACVACIVWSYWMDMTLVDEFDARIDANAGSAAGATLLVTGANSGVGLEVSTQMAALGAKVLMACRNPTRCAAAAAAAQAAADESGRGGSAAPLQLDLAQPQQVVDVVAALEARGEAVDAVHLNAGFADPFGTPVNPATGIEGMFQAMHVSHFMLTELLLESRERQGHDGAPLRVVQTSSATHHLCALPYAMLPTSTHAVVEAVVGYAPGCVDSKYLEVGSRRPTSPASYIQSKMSNMLHTLELPRRHPGKVTAVAVDLGWVSTNIQPWMQLVVSPSDLLWMRFAQKGVKVLVRALVRVLVR